MFINSQMQSRFRLVRVMIDFTIILIQGVIVKQSRGFSRAATVGQLKMINI